MRLPRWSDLQAIGIVLILGLIGVIDGLRKAWEKR